MTQEDPALANALAAMATSLGDSMTAGQVGPLVTCGEADDIASVLALAGHSMAAVSWLVGHAVALSGVTDEPGDNHWPVVLAAFGLPEDAEAAPAGIRPDYPRATLATRVYLSNYLGRQI